MAWPTAAGLALLSGALYWLAFPPGHAWPLAFVCWVPLLVAIERSPSETRTRRAFLLGWLQGITCVVRGMPILDAARSFFDHQWSTTLALGGAFLAYHALFPALVCAFYARARGRGWPSVLAFPIIHAAGEYLFPSPFPWCAAAQVSGCPLLMQGAVVGGPILVGALLAASNALAARVVLVGPTARRGALWTFAGLPIGMALFGAIVMHRTDAIVSASPSARVAAVQPNGPHTGRNAHRKTLMNALTQTTLLADRSSLAFVVWPETVGARVDSGALSRWWQTTLDAHETPAFEAPVLMGATVEHVNPDHARVTNSALLFEGSEAKGEYEKQKLLPFGEYLPYGDKFPALYTWFRGAGRLAAGTSGQVMSIAGHRVAPLICYEDMGTDTSAAPVRTGGAELLVTLTDDAWFGRSGASDMHLALSKYRAIEHRRYLVRAGNQAGTAIIDPAGRLVAAVPAGESGAVVGEIRWIDSQTLHDRSGDRPWAFAAVAAMAMALVRVPRRSVIVRNAPSYKLA